MIRGNTYRVSVPKDTDFLEGWKDSATPHVDYMYDQESIEECEFIDGVYYATYQTWIVDADIVVEIAMPNGIEFLNIPAGEYGKR